MCHPEDLANATTVIATSVKSLKNTDITFGLSYTQHTVVKISGNHHI